MKYTAKRIKGPFKIYIGLLAVCVIQTWGIVVFIKFYKTPAIHSIPSLSLAKHGCRFVFTLPLVDTETESEL